MSYHIDDNKVSLDELKKRIEGTDLVPSRISILDGLNSKIRSFQDQGISTLADLRKELRSSKRLVAFSKKSGVDSKYLILLRREVEGYFPKPFPLKAFTWLAKTELNKLEKHGIHDTLNLFELAARKKDRSEFINSTGMETTTFEEICQLSDLTRIQWVSPTTAKMICESGYRSADKLSAAKAEKLYEELEKVNIAQKYFRGKIGLRDVKRLIYAAHFVD